MTEKESIIKSRDRVRDQGEVFTPLVVVGEMLDMLEPDISDRSKRVLEPSCGNGNFLVEVLSRRLRAVSKKHSLANKEFDVLTIAANIYGIDIMSDNVREARSRLTALVNMFFADTKNSADFMYALDTIIKRNIICGDSLKHKSEIKIIEWTPLPEIRGFEINPHTLSQIENDRKDIVIAQSMSSIKNVVDEIFQPKTLLKKSPKRKRPINYQESLFDMAAGDI